MAKNDTQFSRATALLEDEPMEHFYRPAAAPRPRSGPASREDRAPVPEPRQPREAKDGTEGRDDSDEVFLRARRRVPVRQGILPTSRTGRIALAAGVLLGVAGLAASAFAVRQFLTNDPRFRIDSSSAIQIDGNSQVTRPELLAVFGSDIGRNVFFIPLAERRAELEKLPWVAHATVMRLLPNQLRVAVRERVPIAFVRRGNSIGLVDGEGVLLNMSPRTLAAKHYSFPVVTGISAKDPASVRQARMHLYERFLADVDAGSATVSSQLSEVDISHPEDVVVLAPAEGSDVQVHLGEDNFLERYKKFQEHLPEWRQQYPHLASADMRYQNQVVLEMAKGAAADAEKGTSEDAARPAPTVKHTPHAQPAHTHSHPVAKSTKTNRPRARAQR